MYAHLCVILPIIIITFVYIFDDITLMLFDFSIARTLDSGFSYCANVTSCMTTLEVNFIMADEEILSTCDQETPVTNKKGKLRQCLELLLPPSGFFGQILTRGFIVLLCWAVLWSILGQELLPGGNIFGIFTVIVLAALGGFLTRKLSRGTFPPLLGMLVVGFILRNVPGINVARHIDKKWSATLRNMALVVILTRSGLELDPGALRRLKFTVIRLAFSPCIGEAITVAVVGKLLLDMPWLWGFQLG